VVEYKGNIRPDVAAVVDSWSAAALAASPPCPLLLPLKEGVRTKPKPGFFDVSNLYQNNWNKQNCFETNRNNPKFSEKYQNMLSVKLLRLVFCLFWFN
jgi:hypothetical protein